MISIDHHGNGFRVRTSGLHGSRGHSVVVKTVEAAIEAVKHYYGRPHVETGCPFCDHKEAAS